MSTSSIVAFLVLGLASANSLAGTDSTGLPAGGCAADFTFDPAALSPDGDAIRLALLGDQEPTTQPAPTPAPKPAAVPFGTEGSARLNIYLGSAWDFDSDVLGIGSLGVSYFIADNLSLDGSIDGLFAHQEGDDAGGGGLTLLFRWHFLRAEDKAWTVYADAGAGVMFTSDDVPAEGTNINFTPQIGGGMTFDIGDDNRLMIGLRWYHISNANTFTDNPGNNYALLYAGLSFPF